MSTLKIFYHGNCFDGVSSAAIFTRFYRECVDSAAQVSYQGMAHRRGDPYGDDHDALFDGDVNVVVDFRYSPSSKLTWYCDHHHSAFLEPEHRKHLEADQSGRKHFDSKAPSCTGLLARWLSADHGFDPTPMNDLIAWAELIDAARFESPKQAVELGEPALQIMALLEGGASTQLIDSIIYGLSRSPLTDVHSRTDVAGALRPVLEQHRRTLEAIGRRIEVQDDVAFFDLTDLDGIETFNKFIPYYLCDDLRYVVGVSRTSSKAKVSVGSNPWDRPDPLVNLADLCGEYGGGGHAVVAAISFPPEESNNALQAGTAIAAKLRQAPR